MTEGLPHFIYPYVKCNQVS